MEDDLLAVFVRQRVIQIIWEMYLARIFNMLSRCADRETSMALSSCQTYLRLASSCLYSSFPFDQGSSEQKRAYYLLEESYVSNFRNITISNITRV